MQSVPPRTSATTSKRTEKNRSMSMMNELLKSTSLKSENGDATSTYDCELARDNITVREFVEAVENSVNGRGQKFNEWWVTVSMSIVGQQKYPACARYTIYGGPSGSSFQDIVLNDTPNATIDNILNHYGKYIVDSCQWNGGWGSGGYYLKIKEGIAV